jgi:peroxiredoxin Q/BCP
MHAHVHPLVAAALARAACTLGLWAALSAASAMAVEVGDPAPVFESLDDTGAPWKSADHVGKGFLVVYFYPADMTGGCTKQACGFRDDARTLAAKGVRVVGVSGDSVGNHRLFKKEYDLSFPLLADTEGKVAEAFGVPVTLGEKVVTREIGGKTENLVRTVTAKRWTFVIGPDGTVVAKNTEVAAADDSRAVLALVEKLAAPAAR